MTPIPLEVRRAYGLPDEDGSLTVVHVPSLINLTYVVRSTAGTHREPLVLQRLHPVFGPNVHVDIEAVTGHLTARGLTTPRLIHTLDGSLWLMEHTTPTPRAWRALSYIDGVTVHRSENPSTIESAANLLGRFHSALRDFEHEFVHQRPLHDTAKHLTKLRDALTSGPAAGDHEAQTLGADVLRHAEALQTRFDEFPRRVIHGDPKLSNVMFYRAEPTRAQCMIDLDTVGRGHLAYELGDALRSWCNPAGEDTGAVHIDAGVFRAVMAGYAGASPVGVEPPEILSAIDGFETVSLELASRFAADVIVDAYWGWDSTRFASRREHNIVRARAQLALSRSVRQRRAELLSLAEGAIESGSTARGSLGGLAGGRYREEV